MSRRTVLAGAVGLLWLAGMVALYYASHKPFSPVQAASLLLIILRLAAALALVSLAGGLGRWLSLKWVGQPPGLLEGLAVQSALGLWVLALAALAAGLLGGYRPLIAWAALLAGLVLLRRPVRGWWGQAVGLKPAWRQADGLSRALAILGSVVAGVTLLTALAPPFAFDTLVYHLTLPSLYIQAGRFYYVPQIMYWGMPQTGEMLFTWAALLAGNSTATLLDWCAALLTMAGLLGLLQRGFGTRTAWAGLAALLASFTFVASIGSGYIDWFVMLFSVAYLIVMEQWQAGENAGRRELLLAGALAGMAMGSKYTAGVLVAGGWLAILWRNFEERGARRLEPALRDLVLFSLAAGLAFSPWALKNIIAAGNPFYPLLFPAGAMSALRLLAYQWGKPWGNWLDAVLLPLRVTYYGTENGPGYSASLGALLFGLAPLAWLGWRETPEDQRRLVRLAALAILPGLLAWMVGGRMSPYGLQARLYFVIFPPMAVLAGAGFAALGRISFSGVRLGRLAGVLVFLALFLTVFELVDRTVQQGAAAVFLAQRTRQEYLEINLGWQARSIQAVSELPQPARTLLLWEPRSLYCLPACEPDEILDRWLVERYGNSLQNAPRTPEDILAGWRQSGYTHILVYQTGAEFIRDEGRLPYRPADWQALIEIQRLMPVVKDFGGTYTLYRLQP